MAASVHEYEVPVPLSMNEAVTPEVRRSLSTKVLATHSGVWRFTP